MIDSEMMVGAGLRITVAKDELAAKLATVSRGVSTRTAVLVLGGIQLRADGGQLHLAATDMEVSLRSVLDAQVSDEGTVVVPGRLLLDISRSLPESEVTIEHRPEEAVVVVSAGPATYRLHTYSAEDFPRLPHARCELLHQVVHRPVLANEACDLRRRVDHRRVVSPAELLPDLRQRRVRELA